MRITVILFVLISLVGCNHSGHRSVSGSLTQSKERDVFIQEYTVRTNPYRINDSLQITVKEAWIEYQWGYSSSGNIILIEGYQLCIKSLEHDLKGINFQWTIGINGDKYIRSSGKSSLISDFINLPSGPITFDVQKGDNLSDHGLKEIIGSFELIPKE